MKSLLELFFEPPLSMLHCEDAVVLMICMLHGEDAVVLMITWTFSLLKSNNSGGGGVRALRDEYSLESAKKIIFDSSDHCTTLRVHDTDERSWRRGFHPGTYARKENLRIGNRFSEIDTIGDLSREP